MSPITRQQAVLAFANAFAGGAPDRAAMAAYAARQIDAPPHLIEGLAADTLKHFGVKLVVTATRDIARFLSNCESLVDAFDVYDQSETNDEGAAPSILAAPKPSRVSFIAAPANLRGVFWPIPAYNLPAIDSTAELCALLDIHPRHLDAWCRRWRPSAFTQYDEVPRHSAYYSYWLPKKRGGARLIEVPKTDLMHAQRRLLARVIERVEPHESAFGFRRGHSILNHAEVHRGQELVLKCDLRDFFVTIRASRIHAIFRHLGYGEIVARAMTALVTSRVSPARAKEGKQFDVDRDTIGRYQCDHLPQGAPTSPALANLAAFRLDLRLESLATSAGVRYSRYADDLAFSGARSSGIGNERFYLHVCAIALEEGFAVNTRKTRLMTQSQRQYLTGLIINDGTNICREEYDRLKAILTNAGRHGLASQNRDAHPYFRFHLLGRIAFVAQTNAARGDKLCRLFAKITR